ncbi:outer membrane beta-barrel protein [Rhizobium mesoamericanum]|uniref:Outer membrane beta-barrel protein n=1 Tax=Rhizobium mesoamericanum STM3625 TaxID=1211777 RepID=K0Q1U2_9HYPH|nr:outer membrane beta-barrel protein [Rhizobium mesoamericanum]CCM76404.1 conserved exported hypothetical protein [Rhizobium mesoamericanum STM3625]
MRHWKDTSSLTPLRAAGFAVSMALTVGALASRPAFAQSMPVSNNLIRSPDASATAAAADESGIAETSNITTSTVDNAAQGATTSPIAASDQKPSDEITGSILDEDMMRLNTREAPLDERLPARKPEPNPAFEETPGIRIGTFVLRPTITQSINTETQKDAGVSQTRGFLETDLHATLTSDWSLHQLSVTTDGAWQKNISGEGEEQPDFQIKGDLRLDLPQDTTAHITGGYHFYREDTDDPNALQNADKQSDVQEFSTGATIERDFGILRASTGIDLSRAIYSDATLSDGTPVSLSDRNETSGRIRGRIGYELSPALIPFIEANVGKTVYDDAVDSAGYRRSGDSYGAKVGVELDMGEKLRGEVGVGYQTATFDDDRLSDIDAAVVDAQLLWSPVRGTDVNVGLLTSINPSTTAGESGYVSHALTTGITHQLRDNLTGSVLGGITYRDYPSDSPTSDETVYTTSAGLTWNINRYLDMTSTIGWELTSRKTSSDSEQWRAGVGLKLKR